MRVLSTVLILSSITVIDAFIRAAPGASVTNCKSCPAELITTTTTGAGAKTMDWDEIDSNGKCAVRTFTCSGTAANIEVNGGAGTIGDDGTGVVIFSVTCNAEGTAWMNSGTVVTQIECSAVL